MITAQDTLKKEERGWKDPKEGSCWWNKGGQDIWSFQGCLLSVECRGAAWRGAARESTGHAGAASAGKAAGQNQKRQGSQVRGAPISDR